MKFYTASHVTKSILSLGFLVCCFAVGYLLGSTNKSFSAKEVIQKTEPLPQVAPPKKSPVIETRLVVKRSMRRVYLYQGEKVLSRWS